MLFPKYIFFYFFLKIWNSFNEEFIRLINYKIIINRIEYGSKINGVTHHNMIGQPIQGKVYNE